LKIVKQNALRRVISISKQANEYYSLGNGTNVEVAFDKFTHHFGELADTVHCQSRCAASAM
jgi:hypothetical protein